jgi:hypothetical protein
MAEIPCYTTTGKQHASAADFKHAKIDRLLEKVFYFASMTRLYMLAREAAI